MVYGTSTTHQGGSLTGEKKSVPERQFCKKTTCSSYVQPWLVAISGSRSATGGWWRLVVGDWWLVAVSSGWRLAVGGWRLVVPWGGPQGGSLTKKKFHKDPPATRSAWGCPATCSPVPGPLHHRCPRATGASLRHPLRATCSTWGAWGTLHPPHPHRPYRHMDCLRHTTCRSSAHWVPVDDITDHSQISRCCDRTAGRSHP